MPWNFPFLIQVGYDHRPPTHYGWQTTLVRHCQYRASVRRADFQPAAEEAVCPEGVFKSAESPTNSWHVNRHTQKPYVVCH